MSTEKLTGNETRTDHDFVAWDEHLGSDSWRCFYRGTKVFAISGDKSSNRVCDNWRIRLDSGGYMTATTKKRINQCFGHCLIPYRLYQKGGVWLIEDTQFSFVENVEFFDGIVLYYTNVPMYRLIYSLLIDREKSEYAKI